MPIFDYRCNACSSTYDVFHKTREATSDVVCPSCGSAEHKKLMSVTSPMTKTSSHATPSAVEGCASPEGCCGGKLKMTYGLTNTKL